MGLDTVRLAAAIEECFGVEISDAGASRTTTATELGELVHEKLRASDADPHGPTRRMFVRLRAAAAQLREIDRHDVQANRAVAELFPRDGRRAAWNELGRRLDLEMPALVRPAPLRRTLAITGLAAVAGVLTVPVSLVPGFPAAWSTLIFVHLAIGVITVLGLGATRSLCRELDPPGLTFSELAGELAQLNPVSLDPARRIAHGDIAGEVARILRADGEPQEPSVPDADA